MPGGSISDWPPVTPEDARACYLANIALGMKGSNFYILTGGPNVPGTGTTSDIYDYGASIGPRGEIRPLYRAQKDVGLFLRRNPWLVETEREHDFRLGLNFQMPIAEQYGLKARGDIIDRAGGILDFHAPRDAAHVVLCQLLSPRSSISTRRAGWPIETRRWPW